MQIDFHHATTYVLARLAGFGHGQAATIAHAAQYVDDCVNHGTVRFDNGETYERIASAHKVFDLLNNAVNDEDFAVWVPFHFLPGNNGALAGEASSVPLAKRLVCTPDSPLATELWRECQRQQATPNALHRLGITAHVYSDTFAHQRFTGLRHSINHVGDLNLQGSATDALRNQFKGSLANVFEIGHGGAACCPDLPYLEWEYVDWSDAQQRRPNPEIFLLACEQLFEHFVYFLGQGASTQLEARDRAAIEGLFREQAHEDEFARHTAWLEAIRTGAFSFGPLSEAEFGQLHYAPFGPGSWREAALGIADERDPHDLVVPYSHRFESCDWKLFHDALKEHQQFVLGSLLPAYGLPGSYDQAQQMGI